MLWPAQNFTDLSTQRVGFVFLKIALEQSELFFIGDC